MLLKTSQPVWALCESNWNNGVKCEDEILQLMDSGEAHRHVGQTNM
eukprot:SAG11_NODE_33419_length_277_cov_0.943820_1_plen_45_part_01